MWPGNQLRGLEKPAFVLALESPHRQRATAARNPALRRPCDETVHLPLDAHGCCCPVNWRLLPLPQVTEARMEVPWSPSCPVLLSHNTDLRCEGNAAGYHMPVFVFFFDSGRAGHTSAALRRSIRTYVRPEMDRFRCLFPFLSVIDWCRGFLAKWPLLFSFSDCLARAASHWVRV